MNKLLFAMATTVGLSSSLQPQSQKVVLGEAFIRRETAEIERHADILKREGRIPTDFWSSHRVLGRYGWHNNEGDSSVGGTPSLGLLQRGARSGGSFGAYSFYRPAFEQASRSWWIHGVMEAGSDILHVVNRNAKLTEQVIGYRVQYISAYPHEIRDATVIEIPKWPDGSLRSSELRLNKRAPSYAMTYDIGILPPDYVDMCNCHVGQMTR